MGNSKSQLFVQLSSEIQWKTSKVSCDAEPIKRAGTNIRLDYTCDDFLFSKGKQYNEVECRIAENNLSKSFQEQIQFRSCNVSTQDEYFSNVSVEVIKHQIFGIVK